MIYRKRGITIRWENGRRVVVTESGVAVEKGELFECHPEPWNDGRSLSTLAASDEAPVVPQASYERVIMTTGYAEHECGDEQWSEHTHRFHASIVRGRLRALVDRVEDVAPVADALSRAEANERPAPKRLRLAPNIAAALLPALPGIVQTEGGLDGYGNAIVESRGDPWPNFYRPSYRVRPVRLPLNVRMEHERTEIDADLPAAVALLAFPAGNTARVLIADGGRVYPSLIRVSRVEAVSDTRIWYPYGGGSFGAEMMF
jgi:hypothetical protein